MSQNMFLQIFIKYSFLSSFISFFTRASPSFNRLLHIFNNNLIIPINQLLMVYLRFLLAHISLLSYSGIISRLMRVKEMFLHEQVFRLIDRHRFKFFLNYKIKKLPVLKLNNFRRFILMVIVVLIILIQYITITSSTCFIMRGWIFYFYLCYCFQLLRRIGCFLYYFQMIKVLMGYFISFPIISSIAMI